MQRAISRFSVETDLFPQFNARSSPLQYTTLMGDLIERLGTARQEDASLTSKSSRKIIFEIMTVYITRMIGDGTDERKLFDMLKSAPPKNLVTMLTSPNALYFFLYQRGEEKWGDPNKFEWNPLRVQRNVDFARITLAPLADDLLTPTSPSSVMEEATKSHSDQEEFGGEGGDEGFDHSSQQHSLSDRGKVTHSTDPEDWIIQEHKLRDPTKHMNLDMLRISQMYESNDWKSEVYPAVESYLTEHYSPYHSDILTQVQQWHLPVLMWYLREPGALAEAIREMGLERRKAIRDGVPNAHHLRMYGRDLHSSNDVATFQVTLTGTLRNGSIASTVREWAEYVLPLVHSMNHTMSIEPITSDRPGASLFDASSLPTADKDLLERYARLHDSTASDQRVRVTMRVQTSLDLGKLGLTNSLIAELESAKYRTWLQDVVGMAVSVERCPPPNFAPDVMILHSTQYDVEDDIRGEISRQMWEEVGYELLPTDCRFRFLTLRAPQLDTIVDRQASAVRQARMMCISFNPSKAEELLPQFLRLNQSSRSRYEARATHDFVYFPGHTSETFSTEEFAEVVDKQQQFIDERLVATVKGVPVTVDLRRLTGPQPKDTDRIEDTEAMLLEDTVFLYISHHTREHVFTPFAKIWPLLTTGGRMTGKYVFVGTKTGFPVMKEYLLEHFHSAMVDEFPELDWSQLTITLCTPPHFHGPATVIFPPPSPPEPPAIDDAVVRLPGTVTPAPKTRGGTVKTIGVSPANPLPRVKESPLLHIPVPSLTEQRIREIIREELQDVLNLDHVAREAASHAIDSLLHRLDRRDRQWQQDFVPHAVDLISRSVISSLDTARSHRDMPDVTIAASGDPTATDDVHTTSPSDKANGMCSHTTPPRRSADNTTMFLTPGDRVEDSFATGVNAAFAKSAVRLNDVIQTLSPIEGATGPGDGALPAESTPVNTTLDSLYRIGKEWDTDSEDGKIGVLSDSPWKNEEGVPLAISNLHRSRRGDSNQPELRPLKSRTGTQSTLHPDAATEDTSASTATSSAPTPTVTNLTNPTSTGIAGRTRKASKQAALATDLDCEFSISANSDEKI
eukprot:scaffold471_cov109-Alexandrium_tamarense.AAC.2